MWLSSAAGARATVFSGHWPFWCPLGGLQLSVWRDPQSRYALLPYTGFVLLYDLPWIYRLWRLNPELAG